MTFQSDGPTVRPSTGIPSTMMVEASKDDRGAMLNPDGKYVVSLVDKFVKLQLYQ